MADAYNAPIPLGHPGFVLHPLVLGPERIPVITNPAEVGQHPTLGVLSAAAHGPADPDVVKALHTGLDSIDQEMATKYIGYALHLLTDSNGQRALEELMKADTYEYTSAWTESLKAEGEAKGEAKMLLRALGHKRIEVTEEARERILGCEDPDQLEAWADKVFNPDTTITRIDELFSE